MELKRILANDTRSANEIALKRYGPDVFVISNQRLAGQTELVVAVDVQAATPQEEETIELVEPTLAQNEFADQFHAAQKSLNVPLENAHPPHQADERGQQDDRDLIRSREIVATIREEIAALRKEFRLNQKTQIWQSNQTWAPEIQSLVQGLHEASVPSSLRALLLDSLRDQTHLGAAIDHLVQQLVANITVHADAAPMQGVHVLAGPSGAGKTTMLARLARQALQSKSTQEVVIVSYRDHRAGAWTQIQILCASLGIDCYRAQDAQALSTLLNELSQKALILIDTPGVQMADHLADCRQVCPAVKAHAVVPADVSAVTLHRLMDGADASWQSLMISKLDESCSPWPLLQHLMTSKNPVRLSVACESAQIDDDLLTLTPTILAELALSHCMPEVSMTTAALPAQLATNSEFH